MKAPPLPGVMICCLSTVQRLPSCSMTCPARIRFACCFMALACYDCLGCGLLDPRGRTGKAEGARRISPHGIAMAGNQPAMDTRACGCAKLARQTRPDAERYDWLALAPRHRR